jgi:tetratricopeptide (TPR) repeat protein
LTLEAGAAIPSKLADWRGTERYQVRRFLGAGSMGTVYEAFDRERGQPVALKRLRHFSPAALYLFKQEFRGLVDVVHPNLVRLYELVATDPRDIFFAMELVRGAELLRHLRTPAGIDADRLRDAIRQLADGVQALHGAGKLHRDVKPSNVLVTHEGRVVLLDFGVGAEIAQGRGGDAPDEEGVVGTVAYMAPEQAAGDPPTMASDWYSVGAILYEALTGRPPIVGTTSEVLRTKRSFDAEPPSVVSPQVPADLDALCTALLQRSPTARPSGAETLRLLGIARREPPSEKSRPVVGRGPQMEFLRDALKASRIEAVTVQVDGLSGMGKSALVHAFLDEVAAQGEAVVLRGRAYERESVPYRGVDSWIDALSRQLLRRSDHGAPVPVGDDAWALARLFPVLRRVPEIADAKERTVGDPQRLRRLGFAALRDLLCTLGKAQPLVVSIDDAHWSDADSAALLLDVLRPPHAPSMMLVMTCRDEERGSLFLRRLRGEWPPGADLRELAVGPLGPDDAKALALSLLDTEAEGTADAASDVARESGGSPFLIDELARGYRVANRDKAARRPVTLEGSVTSRVAELPDGARRVLELVAVGGRPLPMTTLAAAASSTEAEVDVLRAQRLVRVGLRSGLEVVEATNARIGEVVAGSLPPERLRALHGDIARALESDPGADPESVAVHMVRAGNGHRAGPFAERAAHDAIGKLAFDRAAQMFRLAIDAQDPASPALAMLHARLAEALAWAGRGQLAAKAYLEAAGRSEGVARLELERAAADQLLASGRIDEGGDALRRVLAVMGTTAPRSVGAALFWLLVYRIRLAIVGLRFAERRPADVAHEARVRIETMFAVAMGFSVVDVLLGACMQTRCLLLAMRTGDSAQILRAALMEGGHRASMGGPEGRRETELFDVGRQLAARSGDPRSQAFVDAAVGFAAFLRGRWKEARRLLDSSTATLAQGSAHWQANGHIFATSTCYFSGELRELTRRDTRLTSDAAERGDLYTTVNLATTTTITVRLVADDPEGARRQLREAMKQWSQSGFFVQQWQAMVSEPDIDLYTGDGAGAYDRLARDLPALRRSFMLNVQFMRSMTLYAHGRCAIASVEARPALRARRIAEARRCLRRLARERMPWVETLTRTVAAATENASGDREATVSALRALIASAAKTDMATHASVGRYRLGEVLAGDEGAALLESARCALASEGVRDAEATAAIYLPGRWSA